MENFLLLHMIGLLEVNRMNHFLSFYDDFSCRNLTFKDWIFHSMVIFGPEICKRDEIMKTRLATN